MIFYDIKINDKTVNSQDIHKMLMSGQRKKAVQFVINSTGCSDIEAEDVVEEVWDLVIQERDRRVESWKNNFANEDYKVIDSTKYISPNPSSKIKCPYCSSTNIKKISGTSRLASAVTFGILSKKIGKQWHCNNCKSDF